MGGILGEFSGIFLDSIFLDSIFLDSIFFPYNTVSLFDFSGCLYIFSNFSSCFRFAFGSSLNSE